VCLLSHSEHIHCVPLVGSITPRGLDPMTQIKNDPPNDKATSEPLVKPLPPQLPPSFSRTPEHRRPVRLSDEMLQNQHARLPNIPEPQITFSVRQMLYEVNSFLSSSPQEMHRERQAYINLIEWVLMSSQNYSGFVYLAGSGMDKTRRCYHEAPRLSLTQQNT